MSDDKITILQVSNDSSWQDSCQIPETLRWIHLRPDEIADFTADQLAKKAENKVLKKENLKPHKLLSFQAVLYTDSTVGDEFLALADWIEPHTLYFPEDLPSLSDALEPLFHQKLARALDMTDKDALLMRLSKGLFIKQYGAKMGIKELMMTKSLLNPITFEGNRYAVLTDDFGADFEQVAYYRYNVPFESAKYLDLWQEMIHDSSVDVQIRIQLIPAGATFEIAKEWCFEGEALKEPLTLEASVDGNLFISVLAKGKGTLKLGPLHYRFARNGLGEYIPGGERFADANGHEFMTYFHPGDLKPPLNVYFSGYRSAEGFEGFFMMKRFGSPFLLVCDPRNEGGSFYLGSESYEKALVAKIKETLDFLGFTSKDLILSGLSMGTFGALYYGSELAPHAIVVGKPLVNLGNMAYKERLSRPNGFGTSLDLLQAMSGAQDEEAIQHLNNRFWKKFNKADFSHTQLALAYMKDDDYDDKAFDDIIEKTRDKKLKIYGKGWVGRHNDNSSAVVIWFVSQYNKILNRDFGRELK
ncbi:accessory Sec system protein Asp2 [Streptococcus pluranimalium]|uniref:accessory Sec system protein Asp2 n=1 Tax=Streptococcus pluranimalium TaxID=82348 RepID=UPI003F68FDDB